MESLVLISCSLMLLFLIFILGRLKYNRYDILDLHVFMVGLFFGGYGLIDALFGNVITQNPYIILILHLHISLVIIVLYIFLVMLPKQIREFIQFRTLIRHFADVNVNALLMLSVLCLSIDWYIYTSYGLLTYVGDELTDLYLSVPNWVGPIKSLNWNVRFCLLILIINLFNHNKVKFLSIYGLLIIPMLALQFVEGRRALIELVVVCFVMWTVCRNSSPYLLRRVPLISLILVLLFTSSNIFQNYRTSLFSITALAGNGGELTSFKDAAMDSEASLKNLSLRTPMWKLNYKIFENQLIEPSNIHAGYMMWRQILNAIPSFLLVNKEIIASEELTSQIYDMGELESAYGSDDFPTNDFASYQTDFGIFSIVFMPFVFYLIIYIGFLGFTLVRDKLVSSIAILFCIQYLMKIENGYDLPILFRNIILIFSVYVLIYLTKMFLTTILPNKKLVK
jgi:hypothetical protein